MEKLELKHIAPYLPFGVKCQIDLGQNEIIVTDSWGLKTGSDYPVSYYDEGKRYGLMLSQIKPLLRPLSDLYKEKDGRVGIVELAKIADGDDLWTLGDKPFFEINSDSVSVGYARRNAGSYGFLEFSMFNGEFIIHRNGYNKLFINNPIRLFTYLFSHHYDVFSLIDKGLAIDINSINHE